MLLFIYFDQRALTALPALCRYYPTVLIGEQSPVWDASQNQDSTVAEAITATEGGTYLVLQLPGDLPQTVIDPDQAPGSERKQNDGEATTASGAERVTDLLQVRREKGLLDVASLFLFFSKQSQLTE